MSTAECKMVLILHSKIACFDLPSQTQQKSYHHKAKIDLNHGQQDQIKMGATDAAA